MGSSCFSAPSDRYNMDYPSNINQEDSDSDCIVIEISFQIDVVRYYIQTVYGYCKQIERCHKHIIIPDDLFDICLQYWLPKTYYQYIDHISNRIFILKPFIDTPNETAIIVANINEINSHINTQCEYQLFDSTKLPRIGASLISNKMDNYYRKKGLQNPAYKWYKKWDVKNCSLFYQQNIILPNELNRKISKAFNSKYCHEEHKTLNYKHWKQYNVLFKYGGNTIKNNVCS
eukprot:429748_1